jgi:hypothetical protein
MRDVFEHTGHGRNPRTVVVLICIYAALLGALLFLEAAVWLMGALALLTLPAVWDLYTNPSAGVRLDDETLSWHTGRRSAKVALEEIEHMRFDTRLDFSVRVTAILPNRKRVRLPYEALPPHQLFEDAFRVRGVKVERHHFSLL